MAFLIYAMVFVGVASATALVIGVRYEYGMPITLWNVAVECSKLFLLLFATLVLTVTIQFVTQPLI